MEKLNMQTTDVVDENIKRIGEMFPNCLTEVKDEKGRPQVAIMRLTAIAFNDNAGVKHIFFIAETKGSMNSMQLKGIEKAKIKCAVGIKK